MSLVFGLSCTVPFISASCVLLLQQWRRGGEQLLQPEPAAVVAQQLVFESNEPPPAVQKPAVSPPPPPPPLVFELKGQYYQVLGHAWDHEVRDFKVVYRPLYHCTAQPERFEAHTLACSHFSRWEEKFRGPLEPAELSTLPEAVRALLLPGPFVSDPSWVWDLHTSALPAGCGTRSGLGLRSHEPPSLREIIGDYRWFIGGVHRELCARGLDAIGRGYEMDHICFRCSTVAQYEGVVAALVPRLGRTLVEGMIGERAFYAAPC
jgi:hypothetical protein